jgi:curved DNA-binding protein
VPAGSQHGDKIKIAREGFPKNSYDKGNHIVVLALQVPMKLSPEERKALEQLKELQKKQ